MMRLARGGVLAALWLAACGDSGGGSLRKQADTGPTPDAATPAADLGAPEPDAEILPDAAAEPDPDASGPAEEPDAEATPDAAATDAAPAAPDAPFADTPPQIAAVETRLGQPLTTAGIANRVTCEVLDTDGVAVAGADTSFEVRPAAGWRFGEQDGELVGLAADTYAVTCVAAGLGLRDTTPARWDVFAGPPATMVASVDLARATAGDLVSVTCDAADAQGNPLPVQNARVTVNPSDAANEIDGQRITFTRAGRYQVGCELPGVVSISTADVVVTPALPAELHAQESPLLPVYDVGQILTFRPVVTDAYGNRIEDLVLAFTSAPALPEFGEARWRLAAEGRYHLGVCTVGPTATGMDLCASTDILVDAGGPAVRCTAPDPNAMLLRDAAVRLTGEVGDIAGVESLTVDGVPVPVDGQGRFALDVQPRWGLNVYDVVARDSVGNENSTFCAFFAADRYHPEGAALDDALQLVLTARAIDDGEPSRPIASLTDLLRSVVNSQALIDTLDASLRAQNPVVPNECRTRVLGVCILSAGAEYRGMRIRGPNTITSTLVQGGMRVQGRINNLEMDVRLLGTLNNTGTLSADYIAIDITFDIGLVGGRPSLAVRSINQVEVGPMDSDFDGFLTGDLLDLIFSAFEGTVRNTAAGALRDFLETQIDGLLTGVLGGLDVSAFNSSIRLPSLGGGAPAELQIAFGIDALAADPQQLRLGLQTRVHGPVGEAGPSAGVPMPPGPVAIQVRPRGTAGASVSLGFVNQVLHGMWRAGVFRLGEAGGLAGDLPDGAALDLNVVLPPAAIGTGGADGGLRIFLGPVYGSILYPGLLDEPLRVTMAATALTSVELANGNEIRFGGAGGIEVERLALAIEGVALSPETRATLEDLFRDIVQTLLDASLSGALPSLPVPDFALPDSLAQYGVPAGTRLGVRNLVLSGTESHWLVDGVFGE